MGQELINLLQSHDKAEFAFGLNRQVSAPTKAQSADLKKSPPVVIDFSLPEAFSEVLSLCIKHQWPLVSGTTGLNNKDAQAMKQMSQQIPILWAPNMSVGVNLFLSVIETIGEKFKNYDLILEDKHHSRKKDSPSGTAKLLQAAVQKASGRAPEVQSVRGGGIVGIHKLWLMGEEETLTIEHSATRRAVFARGAIEAALWLKVQHPGLYTFQDFLRG